MSGNCILIINLLMYLGALIYLFCKRKIIDIGTIITGVYASVAFFCIINYNLYKPKWHLELLPFVYLFCVYIFLVFPFIKYDIKLKYNPIFKHTADFYKKLSYIYIGLSTFSCIVYVPQVIDILLNPNWAELYLDAHEETESGLLIKIANIFFHIRTLGLVLFFSYLIKGNNNKLFIYLLGISSILPIILVTIKNASRGGFVALLISLLFVFVFYYNLIPVKTRKRIIYSSLIFGLVSYIYLVSVTNARFENNPYIDAETSVIDYLGHSMLVFAYGIFDSINNYSWGGFMFKLGELAKSGIVMDSYYGTHFGSSFFTVVGDLYLDFGPFFTILISLLISQFFTNKAKYRFGIPETFLFMSYAIFLFNGVFVHGRGYGQQWIEILIIYYLLKKFQNKRIHL